MTKRTSVPQLRGYRRGDLTKDEVMKMAQELRDPGVRAAALEQAEALDDYAVDALLFDGDLTIDGDFDTGDTGAAEGGDTEGTFLVVRGNLTVRGLYRDACNDAPDLVLVLGDLRAENMITASHLEVRGSLIVANVLVGDYNDGAARIAGDVAARLFVPSDHAFGIGGIVRADYFVAGSNRCEAKGCPPPVAWSDVPLERFGFSVEHPDASAIVKRLRAREPVLRR